MQEAWLGGRLAFDWLLTLRGWTRPEGFRVPGTRLRYRSCLTRRGLEARRLLAPGFWLPDFLGTARPRRRAC